MSDWLHALEGMPLAAALAESVWAYPLVNAAHILGIALLIGAIVPLDLRLLGFWAHTPAAALGVVLRPMAAAGLVIAATTGGAMFLTRASEYPTSELFLAKMALVALGSVNAVLADRYSVAELVRRPAQARVVATLSLACWLAALFLGRLVGYF